MGRFVKKDIWGSLCDKPHPTQVQVAGKDLFLIGSMDFEKKKHFKIVKDLDVFFGLCGTWSRYERRERPKFRNKKLETLYNLLYQEDEEEVLDNIIVADIPDRDIDLAVYEVIKKCFEEGMKVGFGCMAGHGRTGWVLAKLIKDFEKVSGDKAVELTRKRYCKKCVESAIQAEDLGCKKTKGTDIVSQKKLKGLQYNTKTGKWKSADVPQIGYASSAYDEYEWGDEYYKKKDKPMSTEKEWLGDLDPTNQEAVRKRTDVVVEDEENPDQEVDTVVRKNLADAGYVDPADDETKEIELDTAEIEKLEKVYKKWVNDEKLTLAEEALLDEDMKRTYNIKE